MYLPLSGITNIDPTRTSLNFAFRVPPFPPNPSQPDLNSIECPYIDCAQRCVPHARSGFSLSSQLAPFTSLTPFDVRPSGHDPHPHLRATMICIQKHCPLLETVMRRVNRRVMQTLIQISFSDPDHSYVSVVDPASPTHITLLSLIDCTRITLHCTYGSAATSINKRRRMQKI